MLIDDMRRAIGEADHTQRAADHCADAMARLLVGRLRHVSGYILQKLKRELAGLDARNGQWKDPT